MTPQMFIHNSSGGNGNIFKMIILSLIIHLVVVSTVIMAVPSASRHITFGQAYSVQLVGSEVMIPVKEISALSDILQSNKATSSIIVKKEVGRISSTPMKKEETDNLTIEKAISALKQKERFPAQSPAAASAPARGNMPQAQASSRLNEYYGFIQSKVKGNWILPPSLRPKDNVVTIIEVKILRNGSIERLNFEKRSGNRYVDDSAMKAVQKSIPFPPFPEGMMDNYIEIGIRFPSSDLR